jgi:hypothetical protein
VRRDLRVADARALGSVREQRSRKRCARLTVTRRPTSSVSVTGRSASRATRARLAPHRSAIMPEAGRSSPWLAAATPTWCRTSRQCGQRRSTVLRYQHAGAEVDGSRTGLPPRTRATGQHGGDGPSGVGRRVRDSVAECVARSIGRLRRAGDASLASRSGADRAGSPDLVAALSSVGHASGERQRTDLLVADAIATLKPGVVPDAGHALTVSHFDICAARIALADT